MKKGFSFAVLSATVVIMLILLTSMTIAGTNTVNNAKRLSFATEIATIQQAVNNYKEKNNGMYPIKDNIVVDLHELNEYSKNQFEVNGEEIVNDSIVLNEIDYDKISMVSLKYGKGESGENDIYGISPTTGIVYYAKGMKIGAKSYFTLTDELNTVLNNSDMSKDRISKPLIVFSMSETKWSNMDVTVDVKVPNNCTLSSILINGTSTNNYTQSQEGDYQVYHIIQEGNYSVEVKYYLNENTSQILTATYHVNNVDKVAPNLEIESNTSLVSGNSNLRGYIKIKDVSDTLSGVKKVKYEENSSYTGNLTSEQKKNMKSHFENNGEKVQGDTVPIKKGIANVALYVEDNAGNWSLKTVTLNTTVSTAN